MPCQTVGADGRNEGACVSGQQTHADSGVGWAERAGLQGPMPAHTTSRVRLFGRDTDVGGGKPAPTGWGVGMGCAEGGGRVCRPRCQRKRPRASDCPGVTPTFELRNPPLRVGGGCGAHAVGMTGEGVRGRGEGGLVRVGSEGGCGTGSRLVVRARGGCCQRWGWETGPYARARQACAPTCLRSG